MNAAQIAALSQIQAQAIVHARKSTGTPAETQTQIQIQAQALVHAHTQAQIAAGIYKGDAADGDKKQAPAAVASSSLLASLTPVQLQQQQQLSTTHQRERQAMAERHAAAAMDEEQKTAEAAALEEAQKQQLEELHSTFRKQNAAAEYAGVKPPTVPNPTAPPSAASAVTAAAALPDSAALVASMDFSGEGEVPPPSPTSPEFLAKLNSTLNSFWSEQLQLIQQMPPQSEQDFKNHNDLPLARIKRIMKSDEDVRMISAEAPVLFAKACELFVLDLTVRSWAYSQHHKRRTLQKEDIREAIQRTDIFDFLVDCIQP
jgi:nuclear transcription factor Y gamma